MKQFLVILLLLVCSATVVAQTRGVTAQETRRPITGREVSAMRHLADSFLTELKLLYKKEQSEGEPQKYQPERIAFVRAYLMLFQYVQTSSSVIAYRKKDIEAIFGKADTVFCSTDKEPVCESFYGKLQTKYVRINNLRYKFIFKNGMLEAVRREDK